MSAVAVKTFPEPTTIGELLVQLESYQYSSEYMEIMKESYELSLMEAMVNSDAYIKENADDIPDKSLYFGESGNVNDDFLYMLESKQESLLKRVWEKIKAFFRWIKGAFMKLFSKSESTKFEVDLKNLNLGDDKLAQHVGGILEDMQNSILRIAGGKSETGIKFNIAGGDTATIIRRAHKFATKGVIELALPEITNTTNFKAIGDQFNTIQSIIKDMPSDGNFTEEDAIKLRKAAEQALAYINAASESLVGKPKAFSISQAKVEVEKLDQWVVFTPGTTGKDGKKVPGKGPALAYKTGEGTNVDKKMKQYGKLSPELGQAIAALNELNGKWAAECKKVIQVYGEVIKFRQKAADALTAYAKKKEIALDAA